MYCIQGPFAEIFCSMHNFKDATKDSIVLQQFAWNMPIVTWPLTSEIEKKFHDKERV